MAGREAPFSARTAHDSSANALYAALEARRRAGKPVLDLTVANPTDPALGLPYDGPRILRALGDPRALRYAPEPLGLESARAFIGSRVGVPPSRVLLTASTSEAYAFLFKLFAEPGDEVLVPAPSYPLFDFLTAFEHLRPVPYPVAFDGAWHIDFAALRACIGPKTRAILVVSPNNPTGHTLTEEDLEALLDLGLPLVCDEVFESYPLRPPARPARLGAASRGLVFSLRGLSKECALPQLKLAWTTVSGDDALVREAMRRLELLGDTYLSVGAPVQWALPELFAATETTREALRARLRENLATAVRTCAGTAVSALPVEAGWYVVLRLPETRTDEAWAGAFLEAGIYVHPGAFFGFSRGAYVVLSLLSPPQEFASATAALVQTVVRDV